MTQIWQFHHPKATIDHLGYIPSFLDVDDPRPAREQLDSNYQHGGGWRPFRGFKVVGGKDGIPALQYPGDPAYYPVASMRLREETIVLYPHAWVAIFQPDGSFEISRMD